MAERNEAPAPSPLELDPETMRRQGYRVVDLLVERAERLDAGPTWQGATRRAMEARLREPSPAGPADFDALLERLLRDVLPYAGRIDHPRFFAFVPSCPTWPGILGDFIAAGHNIFQGTWLESAGPSELELVVVDWFKEWLGCPTGAAGLMLSGGSAANLTALVCARDARLEGGTDNAVIYQSDQSHSSMQRAARILGFRAAQVRTLPTDAAFRLPPDRLDEAVRRDARAGRRPFFIVANAGATSTGAVDDMPALADVASRHGLWLHADAAYGGFAILSEAGRSLLRGIERADSITLDPHKWLYQPYEAGCLLVRDGRLLGDTFRIMPDYLQDTAVGEPSDPEALREVNFGERGIQLTRSARALKIWLSLKYFGVEAFRAAIERSIELAAMAQRRIEASPELELLSPAMLGVVCFRRRPAALGGDGRHDDAALEAELEAHNKHLVARLSESGVGMVSSTRLRGRYAIHLCVLNHRTTERDVERVLHWLETG